MRDPFDNPYLLRVKVLGREIHLDRKTFRLSVGMRKINPYFPALRPGLGRRSAAEIPHRLCQRPSPQKQIPSNLLSFFRILTPVLSIRPAPQVLRPQPDFSGFRRR